MGLWAIGYGYGMQEIIERERKSKREREYVLTLKWP